MLHAMRSTWDWNRVLIRSLRGPNINIKVAIFTGAQRLSQKLGLILRNKLIYTRILLWSGMNGEKSMSIVVEGEILNS